MELVCDCTPPDSHRDPVPLEPGGKAAVWKAGSGEHVEEVRGGCIYFSSQVLLSP